MELIYDILKKLKNNEIRQVRNHLKGSIFEFEKVGKLFELVTRNKGKDENFFSEKIYGKSPDNAFRVTKSRLKRILEDVILDDKSISSYDADHTNASLQSKKRLLQGEILLGRGAYKVSKNLLLQVVATSRKFSLHSEHFQSQMLLYRSRSVNVSTREFEKGTDELLRLNQVNHLVNEAAIHHYAVTNTLSQTSLKDDQLAAIEQKIARIEMIANETDSPIARYYFLLSSILIHQYTYRYSVAQHYCRLQLELIRSEPAVKSKQKMGNAHFQLTETTLRKGDLTEAEKSAEETLAHFSKDETNYLIVLGTAFRIAYFQKNWAKAKEILLEAFSHPRFKVSPFREALWYYHQSCLLFQMKNYSEALRTLNDATALLRDKMGWNLTFRMLEIMALYEAGMRDLIESKILNLRQFVKRTQKTDELYRSMKLIQILMEWQRNGLDIQKTVVSAARQFAELQEFHQTVPFDPATGELLRFEAWLLEKESRK
ncbi:MAG: hypothetical protein RLZZ165_376 [Bacteroidota bacterium]|jgi:tetratricopeptide (TPR) repeat protein